MTGAFVESTQSEASLWLISLNSKWRPMGRTLLRTGPLAATMTMPRDLFRVALLAEANAIAIVRGEPSGNVAMTKHDERALKNFSDAAAWLNIEFVDYMVISTNDAGRQWCWKISYHPSRQTNHLLIGLENVTANCRLSLAFLSVVSAFGH